MNFVFMSEKGKKVLNVFKRIGIGLSIGFNVVFLIAVIIGSSGLKKQNNNVNCALAESDIQVSEKVDFKYDNKKYITEGEISYTLDLSDITSYDFWRSVTNGLSNYEYVLFHSDFSFDDTQSSSDYIYIDDDSESVVFKLYDGITSNPLISLALAFDYTDTPYLTSIEFNDGRGSVSIDIDNLSSLFDNFDIIKANTSESILNNLANIVNGANINDGIFETLTDSVVSFVGSLGSGIVAMTSVFYDSTNNTLTTIGLLSVIVVAVSLAYFLFRLIIGLIRMRG